jgi:hypothetical protein
MNAVLVVGVDFAVDTVAAAFDSIVAVIPITGHV